MTFKINHWDDGGGVWVVLVTNVMVMMIVLVMIVMVMVTLMEMMVFINQ